MKEYFTQQNTEGFSDIELNRLNRAANEQIGNNTDGDFIKSITDQILNNYEQY